MNVPMLDLTEQYQSLKNEILTAMDEVMASSRFILGENVKTLEADVASYSNVQHGIGVASGSDALLLSLHAAGVGEGDEVITTAFTFFATVGAIVRLKAKPVFVDIDPISYNIDASKIEAVVTDKTKAIIPVHLYGQACEMDTIQAIAKKHNLTVIEDAAQAIGATFDGKKVGELGDTCCFSFFPTKNLGAYGDGGMVVTNSDDLAEKLRVLRVHGSKPKYYHHVLGYNSRLDELQAAVLNIKFKHLDDWSTKRREKAHRYTELISESLSDHITTPVELDKCYHVFHQYTIRTEKRTELQEFLKEKGIASMVYYPKPLHIQPVFEEFGYREGDLPETEKAALEVLSLPMYPELKEEQQVYIVEQMKAFFNK